MTKEKIILSVMAIFIGLLVASGAFYFYQKTKVLPPEEEKTVSVKPSPTPKPSVLLTVDEPKDESIYDNKIVKVSGKTDVDAMIVVLTDTDEDVLKPSQTGDFSTTVTIGNGANFVQITAVGKNGDTNTIERTVSYTSESF